jgi:hypothetical protein
MQRVFSYLGFVFQVWDYPQFIFVFFIVFPIIQGVWFPSVRVYLRIIELFTIFPSGCWGVVKFRVGCPVSIGPVLLGCGYHPFVYPPQTNFLFFRVIWQGPDFPGIATVCLRYPVEGVPPGHLPWVWV